MPAEVAMIDDFPGGKTAVLHNSALPLRLWIEPAPNRKYPA
jgi:hypothetical protein